MAKKKKIDNETTEEFEVVQTAEESAEDPSANEPKKEKKEKKEKKSRRAKKSQVQELEEKAPEQEPAEVEAADPYAPYRYRWEVTRKDKRKINLRRFFTGMLAGILAGVIVGLCLVFAIRFYLDSQNKGNQATQPSQEDTSATDPEKKPQEDEQTVVLKPAAPKKEEDVLSVQEMIEAVKPAVVGIDVQNKDGTSGVASGLIVQEKGYVVTNRHIIENAKEITVYTVDGQSYVGTPIGTDELSDVAVLRIQGEEPFPVAELGDSSLVRQGDWVVAIGTPGSLEFSASATLGIVSGIDRRVQTQSDGETGKTFTVIQTDAAINKGNSGGPLVNVYGQVIGINSMKLSGETYESVGFSLPINGVISIANQIIAGGKVEERPADDFVVGATVFGATFDFFSSLDAQESGLVSGAYVKTVDQDGPAEEGGLMMGDIITVFDGNTVDSLSVIQNTLAEKKAGDEVQIEVYRNRETMTLTITLSSYLGK